MPTNSPADMSNEELLAVIMSPSEPNATRRKAFNDALRRLDRAEGLEGRVLEAMREVDIQYESIPTRKTDDGYTTLPAEMFKAVRATFAAVRAEGERDGE